MALPDIIANPGTFDADATFWLKAAQAAIRRECGWHVTPNTELTGVINSRGGLILRLPARHITSIDTLTDRNGTPLSYINDPETGLLESTDGPWPTGIAAIHYRIHAGYDPDECTDLQGVLINVAKRAATASAGVITSQSVNGSSVSYNVSLMADEVAKLNRYKLGPLP